MPTDIRNFFKKAASAAKAKSSSTGGGDKDKKRKPSSSAAAAKKGTPSKSSKAASKNKASKILSPIDEEGPRGKKKNKQVILEDSDTDATTDGGEVEETSEHFNKKKSSKENRTNDIYADTDDEDDDEPMVEKKKASSILSRKKESSLEVSAKNLKEVSAEDFFGSPSGSSKNKRISPRNSKPKGSYVLDDNDDDDDDDGDDDAVKGGKLSSTKRKKEPEDDDEFQDMDDDLPDEVLEVDEMPSSTTKRRQSPKVAKTPPTKPVRKASPFKKQKMEDADDDGEDDKVIDIPDDDDDDAKPKETPSSGKKKRGASEKPKTPDHDEKKETPTSTAKKRKTNTTSSSSKKKAAPAKKEKEPLLEPTLELASFDVDSAVPECMAGLTFVFTGVLEDGDITMSRDDASDFVKMLGGRVTGSVSGKTSYLVVGNVLEDGRPYHEGKKYQDAEEKDTVKIVMGPKKLYGLGKLYSDKAQAKLPAEEGKPMEDDVKPEKASNSASAPVPAAAASSSQAAKKAAVVNPYASKKIVANPYAKKVAASNPYAKTSINPYANSNKGPSAKQEPGPILKPEAGPNDLWVDKYAPSSTRDILGNKDCVTKLTAWLAKWESRFNNDKAVGKSFAAPQGPWKAALLSGPPGIGKTTTATLVAREAGRDLLEFNASDVRSKKFMHENFGDITGSKSVEGFFHSKANVAAGAKGKPKNKKRVIIMDEVDGMGGGDRGGMAELIQMIKNSRVPIICICNDRQSQKMKSLLPYCFDLRFRRPVKGQIAKAAMKVAEIEGLMVQPNAVEHMAEACGNDVRQVINCLQMWASDKRGNASNALTYKALKERESAVNKDEILRVSLFDASRTLLEGRKGLGKADADAERASFFKRNDAFFVDYSFTGLIVQQNYLKIMNPQFMDVKRKGDDDEALAFLNRMHSASQSMSDYALVENKIRGGSDMNWGLLPFSGVLAVKTGFHAAGPNGANFPGFPEFTTWLGRNSSKGKKQRIMQELNHHMNFSVSGGTSEIRLSYLPFLRQRFLEQMKETENGGSGNAEAIKLMDCYGLDRDDVFENLDEFKMDPKAAKIGDVDSKTKASLTREYNQGSHKSQALVVEQGAVKSKKKKGGSASADPDDPDAINDDVQEEDDDDAEEDLEKIKAAFQKKKRKTGAAKGAATGKTKSGGKAKATKGRGKKK